MPDATEKKLRIGVMAHQFLTTIGANDFLKNLLLGLASKPDYELIFLCPRANKTAEERVPLSLRNALRAIPGLKSSVRAGLRLVAPVAEKLMLKTIVGIYNHYVEACPELQIVHCEETVDALRDVVRSQGLDLIFPSTHVLPSDLPHINYWPDCQPKHFPELFDQATQKMRDERIMGLLATGSPFIINSKHAKSDMIKFYGAKSEQIFELPFAPIIEEDKLAPRPELASSYGLTEPFFIVCN